MYIICIVYLNAQSGTVFYVNIYKDIQEKHQCKNGDMISDIIIQSVCRIPR
jgi:hypothetical protein